jgi:hypothetical protein
MDQKYEQLEKMNNKSVMDHKHEQLEKMNEKLSAHFKTELCFYF